MKIKNMRKTMALLLSASLVSGMCISSAAAENDPGDTAGQTEVSDNEERVTVTDSTAGHAMEQAQDQSSGTLVITADASDKESIEDALNLANVNPEWTYYDHAAQPCHTTCVSPCTWFFSRTCGFPQQGMCFVQKFSVYSVASSAIAYYSGIPR